MQRNLIVAAILVLLTTVGYFFISQGSRNLPETKNLPSFTTNPTTKPEIVSFNASFLIFTNGTKRDFSDTRYHNLSEDVFIEKNDPTLVQVRKTKVTWDDFFKTLPMELTEKCIITGTSQTFCTNNQSSLKFYLNGEKVGNALLVEIKNGDKLLVSYGLENDEQIKMQLDQINLL